MIRFRNKNKGVIKSLTPVTANFSGFGGGGGYGGSGGFSGFDGSGGSGMGSPTSGYGAGGGGNTRDGRNVYTPVFDALDEGTVVDLWMSRSPERMHRVFRHIYMCDSIAGPAVDYYKDMPWSTFSLVGVQDHKVLQFWIDALNAISATTLLPDITHQFLVMGKAVGRLIMDDQKGYFTRVIIDDPDFIRVTPRSVPGFAPKLDLLVTQQMHADAMSEDPRDREMQQQMGPFAQMLREAKEIPLHPANSFYIPRKVSPSDVIGASVYTRILHLVAYEKALINGSITTANRRLSRIRHLMFGDENWVATEAEIEAYTDLFMDAEKDPVGALVATRTGVTVNELGGNTLSDIVKMSDEYPFLQAAKMNALGISETFLTGEASYNSMDQVLSVFLDRIRAHREFIVKKFLVDQIMLPLAKKHEFRKITKAQLDNRIRVATSADNAEYLLPSLVFDKNLRPVGDKDYYDVLNTLKDAGFPITLRTLAAAGGFDIQTELDQLPADLELRRTFAWQRKAIEDIDETAGTGGAGVEDILGSDETEEAPEESLESEEPVEAPEETEVAEETVPEEGESFALGASTHRSAEVLTAITSLPHIRTGSFGGVDIATLGARAAAIAEFLGGRKTKRLSAADSKRLLGSSTVAKNAVTKYLLLRAHVIANVMLSPAEAKIVDSALTSCFRKKAEIAGERTFLRGVTMPTTKNSSKWKPPKGFAPMVQMGSGHLLNGHD